MRPKFIVYCLAIICLMFSWNGLILVGDVSAMVEAEGSSNCYTTDQLELLKSKVISFREFMVLAAVLSIVMSICASFSKKCH